MDELRRTGLDKMNEVYAWDMPDMQVSFCPDRRSPIRQDLDPSRPVHAGPADGRDRGADRSRPVGSARGPSQRRPA